MPGVFRRPFDHALRVRPRALAALTKAVTSTLPVLSAPTLVWVSGNTYKPQVVATYGWTPAALFATSEEGGWYEPGPTTCYTDDGTTAAGENDLVYRMDDLSGNGHHLYQTTEAYRPRLRKSGELWHLEFDGSDDFMKESSAASTIAAGLAVHWVFTSPAEGTANSTAYQLAGFGLSGVSANYASATSKYGGTGANDAFYPQFSGSSASPSAVSFYTDDVPTAMRYPVGSAILVGFEIASSTTTSWVNGEDDTPNANGWAENSVAANLCIADRSGTAAAVATNFFGGVAVESLTSDERAELFTYLAAKGGVTLA